MAAILLLIFISFINGGKTSYLSFKTHATSKSVYGGSYPAVRATNGDDYSKTSKSCFHSSNAYQEWVNVDLLKEYNITSVTVINRVNTHVAQVHLRLIDAEIRISSDDNDLQNGTKCGLSVTNTQVVTSPIIDIICHQPISGRYVMLWFPTKSEYLNICEIRVYTEYDYEIVECTRTQLREDYRGLVSITTNDTICQKWTVQTPHAHSWMPEGSIEHNLCRNPSSGETGPWCYTTDSNVRWDYCDVAKFNMSCPRGAFVGNLNPVKVWRMSHDCLLHQSLKNTMWSAIAGCIACEVTYPANLVMTSTEYFNNGVHALTIAFYIYPYQKSMGNIVGFGNDGTRLRMEQTYSNENLYQSEVSVFYGDQQLTRAHVLLPEVWTFLALTFDGIKKDIKLWRNGEIASIGYTDFTQLEVNSNDINIKIGGDDAELNAVVDVVQLYDRVLDESEMKAARDRPLKVFNGLFEKLEPMKIIDGQHLHTGVSRTSIDCAQMCRRNSCCAAFSFQRSDKVCVLFSTHMIVGTSVVPRSVDYFRKRALA